MQYKIYFDKMDTGFLGNHKVLYQIVNFIVFRKERLFYPPTFELTFSMKSSIKILEVKKNENLIQFVSMSLKKHLCFPK